MSIGKAFAAPGEQPDPPITDYPLLCWTRERGVFTEDGAAELSSIVHAYHSRSLTAADLAGQFRTTLEHIEQALHYARQANLI